jgi:DNA-binding winged helix-turn-helix (wHTH) protein
MTESRARVLYAFERFRVDPQQRLLLADGASGPVPLPPRVFETLLYFVQRPGELLTKAELLKAIWPHVVVEENSLNQHVSMLRRVLGEAPGEHRFIATIPGRGYRFVADVHSVEFRRPSPAPPRSRDIEADHLYTQALALSLRPSTENTRGAIELLQEALRRDARFARAASLLAVQYTTCVIFDFPVADALACAEREAERALRLDPADGTTHGAVGVVEAVRGNWISSATHLRTSRALGSDAFTSGMESGYLTQSVGHTRRALHDAEQTFRAAPTQPMGAQMLALTHLCLGNDGEALRYADVSVRLGQSRTVAPLPEIYALLALRAGRHPDAAAHLIAGLSPRVHAAGGSKAIESLCAALEHQAPRGAATAALDDLESRLQPEDLDQPMRKRLLLWLTMLADQDAAYAFLWRCLDHYARAGTVGSAWGFLWLPEMQAFRSDPRFQQFISRVRLIDYWREYGAPDGCELRDGVLVCGP